MMTYFLFGLWYAMGLIGCFLGWVGEIRFNAYLGQMYHQRPDTVQWCPTPRAIIGFITLSFGGPMVAVIGLIGYTMTYFEITPPGRFRKWFVKPVCK